MNFYLNLDAGDDEPIPLSYENWNKSLKNTYNFYENLDLDDVDDSGLDRIDTETTTKGKRKRNRPESSQVNDELETPEKELLWNS